MKIGCKSEGLMPSFGDLEFPAVYKTCDEDPSKVVGKYDPEHPVVKGIKRTIELSQERFLRELPDNHEGLNCDNIVEFIEETGMKAEPWIVVDSETLNERADFLETIRSQVILEYMGVYFPGSRKSIVRRIRELEEIFGPQVTEYIVVHEVEHSASEHDAFHVGGNSYNELVLSASMPRTGHRVIPFYPIGHPDRHALVFGAVPEEAAADKRGVDFRLKYYNVPMYDNPNAGFTRRIEGQDIWMPAKYFDLAHTKQNMYRFQTTMSSLAAYAFELLDRAEPELKIGELLTNARYDASLLKPFKDSINSLGREDLHDELMLLQYDQTSFLKCLMIAMDIARERGIPVDPKGKIKSPQYAEIDMIPTYPSGVSTFAYGTVYSGEPSYLE